jgi:hypothetical protein
MIVEQYKKTPSRMLLSWVDLAGSVYYYKNRDGKGVLLLRL